MELYRADIAVQVYGWDTLPAQNADRFFVQIISQDIAVIEKERAAK